MGNVQQPSLPLDSISNHYNLIREESSIKILQQKVSRKLFALKEIYFINKDEYNKYLKRIVQNQKMSNHEHILDLIKYWSQQNKGICSNMFKVYAIYEYPEVKLIQQIEVREKIKRYFKEDEVISILSICIEAFKEEEKFVNISPAHIFITKEGNLKLNNPNMMDQNYKISFNSQYYYSPEKFQNFNYDIINQKEKIFSLGLTILHAATLKNPLLCYKLSTKRFDHLYLQEMITLLSSQYSQFLLNMLKNMLQIDAKDRWSIQQLERCLYEYHGHQTVINKTFSSGENVKSSNSRVKCDYFGNINITFLQKDNKQPFVSDISFKKSQGQQKKVEEILKTHSYAFQQKKQDIFTDPKILQMIKQNNMKIQKTNKKRKELQDITSHKIYNNKGTINQSLKRTPCHSTKDLFSQYQLVTSSLHKDKNIALQYEDGSKYQGGISGNMRNGFGKLFYEDGVYYQGFFKDGIINGKGSLFFGPNRPAYIGNWSNNKFNGQGILFNEYPYLIESSFNYKDFNKIHDFWIKYQGAFKDDKKEGEGLILLTNGQRIEGNFHNDKIQGQCIFTNISGKKIKGIWEDNILIKLLQ